MPLNACIGKLFGFGQVVQCLVVIFSLFSLSLCLYEDQVGKFDWNQNYIGKIKFANFDTISTAKKIVVATEENVIAALNIKSGQILWRKVLEKGYNGRIRAFGNAANTELVTVNGGVPAFIVRYWNLATGHIMKEWLIAEQNPERAEEVQWHIKDGILYHILPIHSTGIEVTSYDCKTGEKLKVKKISAPFISAETECILALPHYVCLKGNNLGILFFINIFEPKSEAQTKMINNIYDGKAQGRYSISLVPGSVSAITINSENTHKKRILLLDKDPFVILGEVNNDNSLFGAMIDGKKVVLETSYSKDVTLITSKQIETNKITEDSLPENVAYLANSILYKPSIAAMDCPPQSLKGKLCRYLLVNEDHSVSLVQQKVIWTREESLANIVAVDFVELPMSDRDQAIETEFDQKERNIVAMMMRRLSSQLNQARAFLQASLGMEIQQSNRRADLVRDKFGLHKMIIAATKAGKLYGIESRRGEIIWQLRVPNARGLSPDTDNMLLYQQRGTRHFPHPSQTTLLAADKDTGNGLIFTFNPITGQPLDGGLHRLDYKIKQSLLSHAVTDDFLRGIVILDENDRVHIYPKEAASFVANVGSTTYIFTVDKTTGQLAGYSLAYSKGKSLVAHKVWSMTLSPKNQQITHVAKKNPIERVHSQGRVLGDRSVLYKYINPNLVTIVTQGTEGAHKNTLNLYLLDVVSGTTIFSLTHKRTKGPVHIVHSENWIVYSYFNEKSRRTEIATLELYEGKVQSNNTVFSSLTSSKLPIVERQAFIFPASIESMQETITEKGITSKHILVALANGGVLELPWILVDPRRPVNHDFREEGVIPYMPELPIEVDGFINYNKSVFRVSGIDTSPSGLESTCLVFVRGLDLFYTRVAPSKTFDVLKEDFDYYLIVIVLSALLIASYVTKKLSSQKLQKQAWK